MTDDEMQQRRERHEREMCKLDAEIEAMRAEVALSMREARFPSSMVAALALTLLGQVLVSLVA